VLRALFLEQVLGEVFLASSAGSGVEEGVVEPGLELDPSSSTGALNLLEPEAAAGSAPGGWNLVKSSMDGRIVGELTRWLATRGVLVAPFSSKSWTICW
jgi:hypothetical protein